MKELIVLNAEFQIPWCWILGVGCAAILGAWYTRKVAKQFSIENSFELTFSEFNLLKDLEEAGFVWIARDFNGKLYTYNTCPKRITKMFIINVWKAPKNANIEVRKARVRKHYFSQISRFSRKPYKISEILYLDKKNR